MDIIHANYFKKITERMLMAMIIDYIDVGVESKRDIKRDYLEAFIL